MSDSWDFYLTHINDKPASVFLDLGIASDAPKEDYRVRLSLFVRLKGPRENGLTTPEEADALWPLEDALIPAITAWGGVFVGRITTDGRRDFFFYGSSADGFDTVVSTALAPFGYDYDTDDSHDAGWSFYFDVLYPTPWDWQSIMNRRVLENLKRDGDDLSQARRVHHWLYFPSAAECDRCAEAARLQGFGARALEKDTKAEAENPFGLHLHRIDSVQAPVIDEICHKLLTLAQEHGGDYDGWESQVVKPGAQPVDDAPKE
jgi:uncharacterized protein (TIGR01619 family)